MRLFLVFLAAALIHCAMHQPSETGVRTPRATVPENTTASLALDASAKAQVPSDTVPAETAETPNAPAPTVPGFPEYSLSKSRAALEAVRIESTEDGRSYTNVALPYVRDNPTEVVVYATPNGNTLEQTLGRTRGGADSFRYDVQHVLAQLRLYRSLMPDHNVVLVVLEAPDLSWPSWQSKHTDAPKRAAALILGAAPFAQDASIVVASHSGGGALLFALIDRPGPLDRRLEKFVFLDSNYFFEVQMGHADKLAAWIKKEATRRLIVIAYDDRKITLHGKAVVSAKGGSYRATHRMIDAFRNRGFALREDTLGPYARYRSREGRLDFRIHLNATNKILHSALVSDENGLVFALAQGRGEKVEMQAHFQGPRLFEAFIDEAAPEEATLQ
jgi:hypothetical protein